MPTAKAQASKKAKNDRYIASLTGTMKKAAFAGMGAVAVASDEVKQTWKSAQSRIDKLASRGERFEKTNRKNVRQFIDRKGQGVRKGTKDLTGRLDHQVTNLLGKFNVPSKSDIVELTRRIDALTRKIDKL